MKIITLNIWGGHVFEPLMKFVRKQKKDTDIFCFQEVMASNTGKTDHNGCRINVLEDLKKELVDYQVFYRPVQHGWIPVKNARVDYDVHFGLATFVTRSIQVLNEGEFFVYRTRNNMEDNIFKTIPRNVHWIQFQMSESQFTVCNFHGYWQPGPKIDCQERIEQSKRVKTFLDNTRGEKILCGDFNLLPETESMQILEKDLINLVKEHHIQTTRSTFYDWDDKFADYILVSDGVKVEKFTVLQDQVSDHLPLLLEWKSNIE